MNYTVYDSSVSTYYQNYMYTHDDWLVFDISDTQTIMLIGSYEVQNNKIVGNTRQVVTITTNTGYSSTPDIQIEKHDNRADTISYSATTSYRMYSNIEGAPTQKNATYETGYKTYETTLIILVGLCAAFMFHFIKGLIVCLKK